MVMAGRQEMNYKRVLEQIDSIKYVEMTLTGFLVVNLKTAGSGSFTQVVFSPEHPEYNQIINLIKESSIPTEAA